VSKNLKKERLKNSRSSGKISKNTTYTNNNYMDKYQNVLDKKYRTNNSNSNSNTRTKSFKRIKENEFRKLLRPDQASEVMSAADKSPRIDTEKFNINNLIEGPIGENNLFRTLEDIKHTSVHKTQHPKIALCRSRTEYSSDYTSNQNILKEKCMNSFKDCNYTSDDIPSAGESYSSSLEPQKRKKEQPYKNSVKNVPPIRFQNVNLFDVHLHKMGSKCETNRSLNRTDLLMVPDKLSSRSAKKIPVKTPPPERKTRRLTEVSGFDSVINGDLFGVMKDSTRKNPTAKKSDKVNDIEVKSNISSKWNRPKAIRKSTDMNTKPMTETLKDTKAFAKSSKITTLSSEPSIKVTKPPTGRPAQEISSNKNKKTSEENLLGSLDGGMFDLIGNADWGADFASSLSSNSSQIDFDKMALDAMEEVEDFHNAGSKPKSLHDYSSKSTWDNPWNKNYANKIKTDDIDIIEEDIENEIDSDYSMTLKKGEIHEVCAEIKKELNTEQSVALLNASRDSDFDFPPFAIDSHPSDALSKRRMSK